MIMCSQQFTSAVRIFMGTPYIQLLTMPPLPNKVLQAEFTLVIGPNNTKSTFQTCKNCTNYSKAKNNTRALEHLLNNCKGYKSKQQALQSDTNPLQK